MSNQKHSTLCSILFLLPKVLNFQDQNSSALNYQKYLIYFRSFQLKLSRYGNLISCLFFLNVYLFSKLKADFSLLPPFLIFLDFSEVIRRSDFLLINLRQLFVLNPQTIILYFLLLHRLLWFQVFIYQEQIIFLYNIKELNEIFSFKYLFDLIYCANHQNEVLI